MRIQHNIMAMSAYRNYTNNVSAMKKNLEKLSSGYKINRAGDDAAGLAISEKMRAQITGLTTASKNAKDGISLVQTAEGALTEVHDMLNRMVELATQSANGTYDNTTDRNQMQKEIDQLRSEIDRIADSANFNGIKLLDGSMDGTVTNTTTEYNSGKNNIAILSEIASDPTTEVGSKTVLHVNGSTKDEKTSFKVELHNVQMAGENGDTVKVKVGDQELSFTFDSNVNGNTAVAGKLKPGTVSTGDLASAIAKAWDNGTKLISGQAFNIAANTTTGTLTFTQANTPTNVGEVIAPCKDVTVEFTSNKAQTTQVTQLNQAQKNALVNSDKIVINGTEYDIAVTSAAGTASAICGDFKVDYNNGKLTVVAAAGATVSSISIGSKDAPSSVTGASAGAGSNATTAQNANVSIGGSSFSAVSSTKITFYANGTSTSITISGTESTTSQVVSIGGTSYTLTRATTGTSFALTAVETGKAGNKDIVCTIQQTTGATAAEPTVSSVNISGGADQVGGKATFHVTAASVNVGDTIVFNGKSFTVETNAQDTLKEIAAYANKNFSDLYSEVVADGEDLKITSNFTTNGTTAAGSAIVKYGGVDGSSDAMKLELTTLPENSAKDGTWNVKTTQNKPGAVSGQGVLASTTFKLNSGIVKDNNTLTIGNKTFTFKVGKNSTATGDNIIDLTDVEEGTNDLIAKACERLSQQSHDAFTIGYDEKQEGVISIHEKGGQKVYTNGELSELQSFDELVYFNSADGGSVTETTTAGGKSLMLQIGDTAEDFNQLKVNIKDMHTAAMGVADLSVADQDSAAEAVDIIKAAINYVSDMRGTLGATQNRLDHTINNLSVMTENIQDAESTIRDVDIAEEMMAYTKNNILIQSAQAMLAQANQVPQGVLQLLQ